MNIRIDSKGKHYQHTSCYLPLEMYQEAKNLNIKFSQVFSDALKIKINEMHHANAE